MDIERFASFIVCLSRQDLSNEYTINSYDNYEVLTLMIRVTDIWGPGFSKSPANLKVEPPFLVEVFLALLVTLYLLAGLCIPNNVLFLGHPVISPMLQKRKIARFFKIIVT